MQSRFLFFLKIFVAFCLVIVLGLYVFHQSEAFLTGPQIVVKFPSNGQSLANSLVTIEGFIKNAPVFSINGGRVLTDSRGNFKKDLLLAKGYNIFELKAEDRRGRIASKKIELVLK